jgi:hypothetical protein
MQGDYSGDTKKRDLQLEARAHITVRRSNLTVGRRKAGGGSGQPIFRAGHFSGMRVPFVTLRLIYHRPHEKMLQGARNVKHFAGYDSKNFSEIN